MACLRARPATLDSIARQKYDIESACAAVGELEEIDNAGDAEARNQQEGRRGVVTDIGRALLILEEAACLNESGTLANYNGE